MLGIKEEIMIFLLAFITGMIVRLVYRGLHCLRSIIKHSLLAVEVEDIIFWTGTAVYLFVQIYHTSDGSIRWYFVLGIVLGAVFLSFVLWEIEKVHKKIYVKRYKKKTKNLA